MLLGLPLGLDMDADDRIAHLGADRRLDAVADAVRLADGLLARHDEVEIDERHPPGVAGAQIVRLDGSVPGGAGDDCAAVDDGCAPLSCIAAEVVG